MHKKREKEKKNLKRKKKNFPREFHLKKIKKDKKIAKN